MSGKPLWGLSPGETVEHYSDNVHIVRIAEAVMECARQPPGKVGDGIDRGLIALRLLKERGYSVVFNGTHEDVGA